MAKAIVFHNYTKEDFTHQYGAEDGVHVMTIKAGETEFLPEHVAHLFAKHLAMRVFNKEDKPIIFKAADFQNQVSKALLSQEDYKTKLQAEMAVEENKTTKKTKKKTEEDEVFEGLED